MFVDWLSIISSKKYFYISYILILIDFNTCIFLAFALLYLVWWLGSPQTWSNRNFLVAELFLGVMICWWSTVLSINTLQFTHYCQYKVGYANKLCIKNYFFANWVLKLYGLKYEEYLSSVKFCVIEYLTLQYTFHMESPCFVVYFSASPIVQ